MATTFYYEDTLSALAISGYVVRSLSTTRGAGVITKSQASSATPPIAVLDTGTTPLCFAYRVAAYSQTTGFVLWNHWGLESGAKANYGWATTTGVTNKAGIQIYDNSGAWVAQLLAGTPLGIEYTTAASVNFANATPTALSVADGNWIVVFPGHASAGGTSASGFTLSFSYNGTTASANGDTFATFPDTITAYVAPASRVPYTSPYIQLLPQ